MTTYETTYDTTTTSGSAFGEFIINTREPEAQYLTREMLDSYITQVGESISHPVITHGPIGYSNFTEVAPDTVRPWQTFQMEPEPFRYETPYRYESGAPGARWVEVFDGSPPPPAERTVQPHEYWASDPETEESDVEPAEEISLIGFS